MNRFAYQKLEVWQMTKQMVVDIYRITKQFPSEERFGLISQINKAAISVASNIAEGSGRTSFKDQAHFTQNAYGSLMEIACQFEIAEELEFIERKELGELLDKIAAIADKLSALRKSQLKRLIHKPSTINPKL